MASDDIAGRDLHNISPDYFPSSLLSFTHVNYSCGSCGYQLNLNSCNRNTSTMKKNHISFFSIDESRFTQIQQLRWSPYFTSMNSWGLFQQRTKLLCYKCGNHIGYAYKEKKNTSCSSPHKLQLISWDGMSDARTFDIKIQALQPCSTEDFSAII